MTEEPKWVVIDWFEGKVALVIDTRRDRHGRYDPLVVAERKDQLASQCKLLNEAKP